MDKYPKPRNQQIDEYLILANTLLIAVAAMFTHRGDIAVFLIFAVVLLTAVVQIAAAIERWHDK